MNAQNFDRLTSDLSEVKHMLASFLKKLRAEN